MKRDQWDRYFEGDPLWWMEDGLDGYQKDPKTTRVACLALIIYAVAVVVLGPTLLLWYMTRS